MQDRIDGQAYKQSQFYYLIGKNGLIMVGWVSEYNPGEGYGDRGV